MTATRRDFLVAGSSAFALTALPACAADALASGPDARAEATLSAMAEAMLVDAPESASGLGIDTGPRAALKHRLGNKSPAGQAQIAARVARGAPFAEPLAAGGELMRRSCVARS